MGAIVIQNSPLIRRVLYIATVVVAVAAIALQPISDEWSGAAQDVATYLAGITGLTAASNITGQGVDTNKPTP